LPSHASIFIGTLPIYNRVRVNAGNYLPEEQITLAEISLTDLWIGRLLDFPKDNGLLGNTIIALTADHGEGLGEKDYYYQHEDLLSEPLTHVPLILIAPGKLPEGLRINERVCFIGLMPTICELMEIPVPPAVQGESLIPLCLGRIGWKSVSILSETMAPKKKGTSELYAFSNNEWKLIWAPETKGYALYDLKREPDEKQNLCDYSASNLSLFTKKYLPVVQQMDHDLKEMLESRAGKKVSNERKVDKKTRHMLKSLGYLD
jgi:arylsulfatase A-like enzyme